MSDLGIDPARIESNWLAITAELDAPRPAGLERALRRVGVPASVTRLLVSTPSLRRSWYLSIVLVVVVGLGAAQPDDQGSLFTLLVMAPLLPVLGVAMAYGSGADPSHEIQLATPLRGLRLVALRAATVLVFSIVLVGLLAVMSAAARPMAAAWLLPALAVTTASLAVMTVVPPRRAASLVAVLWIVAVVVARVAVDDPLAAFRIEGQIASAVAAAAGIVVLIARRSRFDRLELAR
jgi:hypothetical protein